MDQIGLILLILAYTISIAAIIMQLLCYRKEIEYKETILFTCSLLLLVSILLLYELFQLVGKTPGPLIELSGNLVFLLLACTTPINIHTERIINNPKKKNRFIILSGLLIAFIYIISFLVSYEDIISTAIQVFLFISIIYSMIVISKAKPSLLVLHREKAEKKTSRIIMIFLPLYVTSALLNEFYSFIDESFFDGAVIISLLTIFLALSKFFDDFHRLSLFTQANNYSNDKLSYYKITNRESEVLNLLIKGSTYKVIGEQLFISIPTVKTHVSNIYQKMNINNKVELINLINK